MKVETKTKAIEVTFPSGRRFQINIYFEEKKVIWDTLGVNEFKTVLDIRTFANELSQIAQLVQDELNKVHGYEFNQDVENVKTETLKEIVDSVNEETEEDKLRKIYFEFYDKMDEPERSQAKDNWSYKYASDSAIPLTIPMAIRRGFKWSPTPQRFGYWDKIDDKYEDK